jgi:DNA-cytosine methyltransferase
MNELRTLDLFSGIGGFSLGLERAGPFRTAAFCEQDPFCQAVLRKHWPDVPIFDDIRELEGNEEPALADGVDLICGGFPCQPWSVAGQQRGAEDDRDLWPAMAALIEKLRPKWVIGENVRGFVSEPLGLQRSLSDLESIGYEAVPFIIPACAVDAPHRRDRVWIVAHRQVNGRGPWRARRPDSSRSGEREQALSALADADREGLERAKRPKHERTGKGFTENRKNVADAYTRLSNGSFEEVQSRGQTFDTSSEGSTDVAHANGKGLQGRKFDSTVKSETTRDGNAWTKGCNGRTAADQDVSDTNGARLQKREEAGDAGSKRTRGDEQLERCGVSEGPAWIAEQCLGLPHDGLPGWLGGDWERGVPRVTQKEEGRRMKIKALGNSVVPQVVAQIGKAIIAAEGR